MHPTGSHFNYYQVCKRKLWLFAIGINMEHTSDLVYDGKLIHENAYPQRSERYEELEIEGIKIDYYDARNKVFHEIKRSDKVEQAHEWQVKYYIYVLECNGVEGVTAILEYPTMMHSAEVLFTDADRENIQRIEKEIISLIHSEKCPPTINAKICKSCSYFEFCYVNEE